MWWGGGGGGEKNIFLSGVFLSFHLMGHFLQEVVLYAMYSVCKLCTMHKALLLKTVYSELFEVISKLCWGRKTCLCQEFCVLSSDGHFLQEVMLCVMYNACKVCTMPEASFIITVYSELFEVIFKLCWGGKMCFSQWFCVLCSDGTLVVEVNTLCWSCVQCVKRRLL